MGPSAALLAAVRRGPSAALVAAVLLASGCRPVGEAETRATEPVPLHTSATTRESSATRESATTRASAATPASASAPARATTRSLPEGFEARGPLKVEKVVDGDTIVVAGRERIRVLGIDTPEMNAETDEGRRLAVLAKAELSRLLGEGRVVLVGRPDHRDIHGRTLAYVHAPGAGDAPGEDLGARLLSSGLAHVYPSEHPRLAPYLQLQEAARSAQRGVWTERGLQALDFGFDVEVGAGGAREQVGRKARVIGKVFDTHRSRAAFFVNLGPDWRKDFTAVILERHWPLFPADAEKLWLGRVIAVTGEIELRDGRPQVLLRDPGQLELLEH